MTVIINNIDFEYICLYYGFLNRPTFYYLIILKKIKGKDIFLFGCLITSVQIQRHALCLISMNMAVTLWIMMGNNNTGQ